MLAYWVKVGMLSRVGRVCCALHWEEKEVGCEPRGLGGKVWGAWWMRRSERVGAERIVCCCRWEVFQVIRVCEPHCVFDGHPGAL